MDKDIQVSGLVNFPEWRWREAILYYLFGIWGEKQEVMSRPKLIFGDVTLRLDLEVGQYFAYGRDAGEVSYRLHSEEEIIDAGPDQVEVEQALIRFVKNDRKRLLVLHLKGGGSLSLWKKQRRGEYGIAATDLPTNWEGLGPGMRR